MDYIIVGGGLKQHDDDMLTEEISVSATCCVCLIETSETHACRMAVKEFVSFAAMMVKLGKRKGYFVNSLFES